MNKKIFIGFIFLISIIVLAGGCGSSHKGPITSDTNVNSTWNGAWTSSSSGTAEIASKYDKNYFDELSEAFGEITDEMLAAMTDEERAMYEEYKSLAGSESIKINASVTSSTAIFEDCDVSKDKGTAKMTAVFIFNSDDVSYVPMLFNGVTLTTTRSKINEWTAEYSNSNGDTLLSMDISMPSNEEMNISGTIKYLSYNCEFSAVINKNAQASAIQFSEILDGTWKFEDVNQGGGYIASDSNISPVVPEDFLLAFNGTKEENSAVTSRMIISSRMLIKSPSGNDPVFQYVIPSSSVTITKINGDLYKIKDEDGTESYMYVENTDEIYVFNADTEDNSVQSYLYLPLKKISVDLTEAVNKNWSVAEGGGYLHIKDPETYFNAGDDPLLKAVAGAIKDISFTIKSGSLSLSNVISDDNAITADVTLTPQVSSTLPMFDSDFSNAFSFNNVEIDFSKYGSILASEGEEEGTKGGFYISFISETEALLSIEVVDNNIGIFSLTAILTAE